MMNKIVLSLVALSICALFLLIVIFTLEIRTPTSEEAESLAARVALHEFEARCGKVGQLLNVTHQPFGEKFHHINAFVKPAAGIIDFKVSIFIYETIYIGVFPFHNYEVNWIRPSC